LDRPDRFDVAVLGAGAAGLMCALTAGGRGRRVVVLEHAAAAGRKILISGGGRCNFTNLHAAAGHFHSANPRFCTSALSRYTPADFLALVQRHGIAWHEKTLGQLFCDGSAREIVAMLLAECAAVGVELRLGVRVSEISGAAPFRIEADGQTLSAESLVLATGGLSIPKMGATGFALELARRYGLDVVPTAPALVPLTLAPAERARTGALSGVALPVVARCNGDAFREAMLFTHRGLSGPAILQISSCWEPGQGITLDLLPDMDKNFLRARKRDRPKAGLRAVLAEALPQRLADAFLPAELAGRKISELADKVLDGLAGGLKAWQVNPAGTEGYAKAEVMRGGVDTAGLSSQTMGAIGVPGLFVVGEAVDVTGWLGGYNFQWAWASGYCAGMAA
jgi:predicted Rossmann fold flavoprotein